MNKLLCFDLDGTLLRDDKSIPKANIDAVRRALDAGCFVSIVTGRSYKSSFHIAKELGLYRKNCFLINFQGNAVFSMEDRILIYESGLPKDTIVPILKDLNEHGLYAHTFDYEGIISNRDCKDLQLYNRIATEPITYVDSWDDLEDKIYPKIISINFTTSVGLEKYQKDFLNSQLSKEISCFFSDPKFLEFCNIHSSKGNAMTKLANYLHVDSQNVVAVGDERNDISMIQQAGIGCAVANAHPEAKEVADYISNNTNNQGGVAEVIEKFVLN